MAILKQCSDAVISQPDTISVMRYLKSCTKVLFDVDGLLKVTMTLLCTVDDVVSLCSEPSLALLTK